MKTARKEFKSLRHAVGNDAKIPQGIRYRDKVPDTLDLAERASFALNALTGLLDPDVKFEQYFEVVFTSNPPYMRHLSTGRPTIDPKFLEALPYMRIMTGSDLNLDAEQGLMDGVVEDIAEDGLFYSRRTDRRPWHEGLFHVFKDGDTVRLINEDFANPYGNARLMLAMRAWYQRDHNPKWLKLMGGIAQGLTKIAIHRDDYAYFPESRVAEAFSYPKSGWKNTDEPASQYAGKQGDTGDSNIFMYHGSQIWALSLLYRLNNDPEVIKFAREIVNFVLKPKFWGVEGEPEFLDGVRNAHWTGHIPGHMEVMKGLLEYACLTRDDCLKEFVRRGYEYALNFVRMRIGYFPGGIGVKCGCSTPRLATLAIMLTDAGLGDYWEDVDQYVRNNAFEAQLLDADLLSNIAKRSPGYKIISPQETSERVIERALGSFFCFDATSSSEIINCGGCCLSTHAMALYYVWESIVRFSERTARINLLLNRASPWLDIESYLPYEGKVVIKNKTAKRLFVRIPLWVDEKKLKCKVNSRIMSPCWFGRYLVVDSIRAGDVAAIEFPITETVEQHECEGEKFRCIFKGNTLVDFSPRKTVPYPFYRREKYRQNKSPIKEVERYVTSHMAQWHGLNA